MFLNLVFYATSMGSCQICTSEQKCTKMLLHEGEKFRVATLPGIDILGKKKTGIFNNFYMFSKKILI